MGGGIRRCRHSLGCGPPAILSGIDQQEAVELANRIEAETGLSTRVIDEGDDDFRVDIDAPPLPGEVRATVSAYDHEDWPWLYERHIRSRLSPPPHT